MRIVAQYSFANGDELIRKYHAEELAEVELAIASVDAEACRTKASREKTMAGRMLYSPIAINLAILENFLYQGPYYWNGDDRVLPIEYQIADTGRTHRVTFTMDGIKNKVGLEIQLGKYAFVEYDICAKLPIFKRYGRIECAIEAIPMNAMSRHMSTGPGWFERTRTILANRGYSDLDVPILLLGIDA